MRIVLDYRPALRQRTGVGEFVHELVKALAERGRHQQNRDELAVLSASLKDRPAVDLERELSGVDIIDWRLPVRALTWAWNRLEWPPVEWLAGAADVVHAQSPLLIPARRAAQVVTIHDLDFLQRPDRADAEMRRDYPKLVRDHARRAHHVVVSSEYAATQVRQQLEIDSDRVSVCSPGPPSWSATVARDRAQELGATILFMGTISPRKNVEGLLAAYRRLRERRPDAPRLVLAGGITKASEPVMKIARQPPLDRYVEIRGYVPDQDRPALYRQARMLVLPSFEEGFGLPVLEAMASGVPVVISNRGSLPEVAGNAATPVDPGDVEGMAEQMELLLDDERARAAITRGFERAVRYTWAQCAAGALAAYRSAISVRTGQPA